MVTLVSGIVGGFVATIVMTVFMMALGDDSPPPTAALWAKYVSDGDPQDAVMPGMVLHLLYGTIAGGVFAVVIPVVGFVTVASVGPAVFWGLVYGLALFVIGTVFWFNLVLGLEANMKMAGMMLLFHLVYGIVLGAWVGYGILG